MSSYIISIAQDLVTANWAIAKRERLWDMRIGPDLQEGDIVYFWGGGVGLLGRVQVTEAARPIANGEKIPWKDAATGAYRKRFLFRLLSDRVRRQPGWGAIKERTSITQPLPHKPRVPTPAGEKYLEELFS